MSTETRPRVFKGIIDIFKALGSTDTIEYDSDIAILDPVLIEALENIEKGKLKQEVENPTNMTGGSKKSKGGFAKKINPNTEKAMRAMHNDVQKTVEDRARE